MSELARITTHYLEQIAKHAVGLSGFDEIGAELSAAAAKDAERIEALEARVDTLEERLAFAGSGKAAKIADEARAETERGRKARRQP